MRFRSRLFTALLVAAVVPLAVLAYGVRREMTGRLDRDAAARAAAVERGVRDAIAADEREIRERLAAWAASLADDNTFRLATIGGDTDARRWLIGWAAGAMRPAGLDLLRLYDADGRILSSGHFRGEFDRAEPALPRALGATGSALARVRDPGGSLLALAASDTFSVGGRTFALIGGRRLDSARVAALSPDAEIGVRLVLPGTAPASETATVAVVALPFVDAVASHRSEARLEIARDRSGLAELRRRLDVWFVAALTITLLLSLVIAAWLAGRIAAPITELADKTALVDLDRLDQRFGSDRDDEIGALAGLLDAMTVRLRRSASRLREAERRAATGDLARQVNHDIKNGLAPIRHVLRHLGQVAERDPAGLAAVYGERRATLESSVEYLDGLAREYARLTPAVDRSLCRPGDILRSAAAAVHAPDARVELRIAEDTPPVRADPVVLRRIVDNLAGNAADALEGRAGVVTLSSSRAGTAQAPVARLVVADSGRGMTRDELERAFQDFVTTKPGGTGLGLSVVRRLVGDLGGSLRVETAPGAGSRFIVELPAAASDPPQRTTS